MSAVLLALHDILPAARSIRTVFHLTADSLLLSLKEAGLETRMERIPDLDSGLLDDDQIAAAVFAGRWHFHRGPLPAHTPACSRYDLPDFEIPASGLPEFIAGYQRETLFDGDVILVARESRSVTVFHHEGAFGHFALPPPA